MLSLLSQANRSLFSSLVLAEHNGKSVSKNTLKLLTAAHKFGEPVTHHHNVGSRAHHRHQLEAGLR